MTTTAQVVAALQDVDGATNVLFYEHQTLPDSSLHRLSVHQRLLKVLGDLKAIAADVDAEGRELAAEPEAVYAPEWEDVVELEAA